MPNHAQHKTAQGQAAQATAVVPFKAHIPDEVLADLRRRLGQVKWPDQLPGTTWEHGADIGTMRKLADYWEKKYDWRAQEARINRFAQFTTEIDGQRIHFIHQRSARADAIPLLLLHGWPGSIVEFLALIEPLTNPKDSHTPAFNVIIPSLPGFGFSGPTRSPGWDTRRMAKAFVVLMDRLGYSRYGIQGGDWGSFIARRMAFQAPQRVIGLHLNFLPVPPPTPEALAQLSDEERRRFSGFQEGEDFAYFKLHEDRPQTVAYALTDSPVGWLAWTVNEFRAVSDHSGDFLTAVDRDSFFTNITLYWVTGTVGSSLRIYREEKLAGLNSDSMPRIETPVAYADFPKEAIASPYRWIDKAYNIIQRTEMPKGGHFAALEQPDLLIRDIRTFFAKLKR
ncbi:MAG: epoxide hydrolase [Pyrinomonadaceae bacterium]|nr:epoxide hydrolase [Pyrinomonadaceae bacterium]